MEESRPLVRHPLKIALVIFLIGLLFLIPTGPLTALRPVASAPNAPLSPANVGNSFDWPELHRSPYLTGYTANTTLSTANAATLGVKWATDLYAAALDSPVVAYDPSLGQTLAYIGTEGGNLLAVNVANGAVVWGAWLGSQFRGTPVVSNGSVYASTFSTPAVYRVNATTGAVQCSRSVPMPVEGTPVVVTPPGGVATLYVGTNDATSANGPFMAINAGTCAVEWEFTGYPIIAGSWTSASYAIDAHGVPLVLFGTSDPDSAVYALNAVTGAEVWRYATYNPGSHAYDVGAGVTISPPGLNGFADGVAYVPNKYGIMYALDLTTGALIWQTDFNQIAGVTEGGRSTAALDGTNLVFGYNGGTFDLNAVTGAEIWESPTSSHTEVLSSPAIAGPSGQEIVAAGDVAGQLDVISLGSGSSLYHYRTGGYIAASPAISNGNILIASSDGFLYDFANGGGNDAVLPSTTLATPPDGSSLPNPNGDVTVSGTATAPDSVGAVRVAVQTNGPSGTWWNAASGTWVSGPAVNPAGLGSPGATATTWSLAFPVPSGGGVFQVFAFAVSGAGQSDIKGTSTEFTVLASTKGPHLEASPSVVAPGASVTVTGAGFGKSEKVTLALNGATVATATTSSTGSVPATKVKVGSKLAFGNYAIVGAGATSGRTASVALTVTNSWEESGFNAGHTGFAPNDPVLDRHVDVGGNTWMYLAWHFAAGAAVNVSPAVVNGVAYVGDAAGQLVALDAANGGTLWTWSTPDGSALVGAPAVDLPRKMLWVGSANGTLYAISTGTGALLWSASIGGLLTAPVDANGEVYTTSSSGAVAAFVGSTGALSWSTVLSGAAGPASLDSSSGILLVGEATGNLLALNANTGATEWSFAAGGAVVAAPTVSGGVVYFGSGSGDVYALTESNGAQRWSYSAGSPIVSSTVLLTQGTVGGKPEIVAGASNGVLSALLASTGTLNFQDRWTSAIVGIGAVNGVVVVETMSGEVGAARGYTNLVVWNYHTGAGLLSSPVIVDGAIFVAAADGNFYAFTTYGQAPE
jgi:outer membrane protein assembly factor BamB